MVTETLIVKELASELKTIRKDLDFIKEHMVIDHRETVY